MALPVRIRKPIPQRLRSAWKTDDLRDDDSPRCLNVRFKFGECRQTPGRNVLAGPVTTPRTSILGLFRLPLSDGTEWTVTMDDREMFRWGRLVPGAPRQWHNTGGPGFTIASGRRWSAVAGEDKLFFCRGDAQILRWPNASGDPATSPYEYYAPSAGTVPTARFLEYYNDRLLAAYTVEGGITHANRIRWPVSGNHLDWANTGSGFLDVYSEGVAGSDEPIAGLKLLSDRVVIYRQHSITDLIRTGTTSPVFVTQSRVHGRGLGAPYTLASNGQVHFFLGNDAKAYAWDGTQLQLIGGPIIEELQSVVDPAAMNTYFGTVATTRDEYWLVIGSDVFVYDYLRDTWSRDSFPDLTALAEVEDAQNVYTWSTIPGKWMEQSKSWERFAANQITTFWGGRSDGSTMVVDDNTVEDYFAIGSIMDRYVETPDWEIGYADGNPPVASTFDSGTLLRLQLIYEFVNDTPFEMAASFDRGRSWPVTQQVTPTTAGYNYFDTVATGRTVRFRFRENNATGQFRWRSLAFDVSPGGTLLP